MAIRTSASLGRTVVFAMAMAAIGIGTLPPTAAHGQTEGTPAAKSDTAKPATAPAGSTGKPAASGSSAAATAKDKRTSCEHYVGVFAGREKDSSILKKPEAKALAPHAADLITCNAVRADSDEPCKMLEGEAAEGCRASRSTLHELRAYPNGRSYMFDDRKYQECKQSGGMPLVVCDALRKALRAGDPAQCTMDADFVALCRQAVKDGNLEGVDAAGCTTEGPAIRKMMEGQCRALVNLDAAACDVPGPHAEGMAEQCRKDIESRKSFGKGLKALAKSGSATEQALAKAALDDPDACKDLMESTLDACVTGASEPAADTGEGADTAAPPPAGAETPAPVPQDAPPPKEG